MRRGRCVEWVLSLFLAVDSCWLSEGGATRSFGGRRRRRNLLFAEEAWGRSGKVETYREKSQGERKKGVPCWKRKENRQTWKKQERSKSQTGFEKFVSETIADIIGRDDKRRGLHRATMGQGRKKVKSVKWKRRKKSGKKPLQSRAFIWLSAE